MTLSDEARKGYKAVWEAVIVAQERDLVAGQDLSSKRSMIGAGGTSQDLFSRRSINGSADGAAQALLPRHRLNSSDIGSHDVLSKRCVRGSGSPPQTRGPESGESTTIDGEVCQPNSPVASRNAADTVAADRHCGRGQERLVNQCALRQRATASTPRELGSETEGLRSARGSLAQGEDWRAEVRWRA